MLKVEVVGMKKLRITVEGKAYDVTVEVLEEESTKSPIPKAAVSSNVSKPTEPVAAPVSPKPAPPPTLGEGIIGSPLAGKVVAVDVKMGAAVNEGDNLVTLEAMKMNTFVSAPRAGQIIDIKVQVGDSVEEGQALLTLN